MWVVENMELSQRRSNSAAGNGRPYK
jgi:hypothetical protein